jgi:hypothetical protein
VFQEIPVLEYAPEATDEGDDHHELVGKSQRQKIGRIEFILRTPGATSQQCYGTGTKPDDMLTGAPASLSLNVSTVP